MKDEGLYVSPYTYRDWAVTATLAIGAAALMAAVAALVILVFFPATVLL